MTKPDHIVDLERRQKAIEDEIAKALLHCSTDDLMIVDLKSRMLHLKEELERFCNKAMADKPHSDMKIGKSKAKSGKSQGPET